MMSLYNVATQSSAPVSFHYCTNFSPFFTLSAASFLLDTCSLFLVPDWSEGHVSFVYLHLYLLRSSYHRDLPPEKVNLPGETETLTQPQRTALVFIICVLLTIFLGGTLGF